MAASDYSRGTMKIEAQKSMFDGFMKAGVWGSLITLLGLAYSVFTLSIGMNWLVSLAICAGAGIGIGMFMGLGGAWIATIVVLSGLAMFIQLLVWIGSMLT